MMITCIKGGLLPDFNKCVPFREHDLAMYINEDVYFVFYDIYDCKSQSRFSLPTFLDVDKDAHISKEEIDYRSQYFLKHKRALVSKALKNPEESLFFNSIESEVLSKYFCDMKFSCKVDIFINNSQVYLEDITDNDNYGIISEFIDFFEICECVNVRELVDVKRGIFNPKHKKRAIVEKIIVGAVGVVAGVALGYKVSSNKISKLSTSADVTEQEV